MAFIGSDLANLKGNEGSVTLEVLLAYVIATAIIVVVPGPNIMLVVNDSMNVGFKKGLLDRKSVV